MEPQILKALLISLIAGLSTTVGSLLGLFFKRENPRFMSFVLGFAAGIMVGVSFFEMLPWGFKNIGFLKASLSFLAGFVLIFLIDYFVPHEYSGQKEKINEKTNKKLLRTGFFLALGIAIHNFPEGMATFYSSIVDIKIGAAIAIAIAVHNIPEGIAVSAPVFKATGSRGKAFLWSFLSGVAEPVGALITALILLPYLSPLVLGYILSGVSGLMAYIAVDELLPVSKSYGFSHLPVFSFILGLGVMIMSLFFLK